MYREYAADPRMRINLGIRRRLAPLHGERPRAHRADEQPAAVDARHADHLLRRRDRHGRQHLPRRPQRRAHADAVEPRPQRRLLARRPAALYLPPIMDPVYGYQAVNVEAQEREPSSLLNWMQRMIAVRKALPGVRPRHADASCSPATARSSPTCASTSDEAILCVANLVALRAAGRARPRATSRAACRSSCSAARRSRRSASCRTC